MPKEIFISKGQNDMNLNETLFDRLEKDDEPKIKTVSILFSDGTVDVIDQITHCTYTTSYDGSEEGISVLGKYHAFVKN